MPTEEEKQRAIAKIAEQEAKNQVAVKERNVTDAVLARIQDMMAGNQIVMPPDYSPENALKSAWVELQKVEDRNHNKALEVCTKTSVMNSLLDMVVQGLSPAKKQCYFIVYGKELQLSRSYAGSVAVAKRFSEVKNISAQCVFEDDEFDYMMDVLTGGIKITKHLQKIENRDVKKIRAAYAVVTKKDGSEPYTELMSMDEIRAAWNQGATKGASPAHRNFTQEMAKKTVINRAAKLFINTSSDNDILVSAYNNTTESDYMHDEAETVIDVEDAKIVSEAEKNIFSAVSEAPESSQSEENDKAEENIDSAKLSAEEKAEIEAEEAKAAMIERGKQMFDDVEDAQLTADTLAMNPDDAMPWEV